MPFITRGALSPELRSTYDQGYKNELRQRLQDPTLTTEQREQLMARLDQVGQPKIYGTDLTEPSTAA